ncbi:molybdate ABC transporter substrate-binding protein [Bacillus sp. Marseille-P3661]|uniref:molybdate ABC transporter substrate-binding protein n=1 Tax=Bacillus sp. Marseille-P3661 TaxID=1936234 RepID=UPI000C840BA1|nr:molybdate ABC transporter substrate-binding protein [Bacillus sp. Marseille-P3661]
MKNNRFYFITILTVSLLTLMSGCSNSNNPPEPEQLELNIAAASSLISAFSEVGNLFEEETNTKITFSFGSTGQLTEQIENGAPFDLFAAANISFLNYLKEKDLIIADSQTAIAYGRIGIATLPDSTPIKTLEDLLKPEIKKVAIANPEHAPYGLAAKQALESAGVWDQLQDKLVYGRNISDTLSFIETGNVEAGIVALSLHKEDEINFHIIDESLHAPLEQSMAIVSDTDQETLAYEFIEFIKGPIGKPIMERYGFIVPEGK